MKRTIGRGPHRARIGVVELAALDPGQANQHARPAIGGEGSEFIAGTAARILEGRLQDKILRRIGRQEQLRKHHERSALRGRPGARGAGFGGVADRIADGWIKLGESNAQAAGHENDLAPRPTTGNGAACMTAPEFGIMAGMRQ